MGSGLHEVTLADHHFGEEVDDGVRRLVWVALREHVARISRAAAGLPRNEPEHPAQRVATRCSCSYKMNDNALAQKSFLYCFFSENYKYQYV